MIRTKKICKKYGREISVSNYNKHVKACENKIEKEIIKINHLLQNNGKYKCPYCGKEYTKNGIGTHIWRKHKEGQNHDPNVGYIKGTRKAWNKGLTKETNESVKRAAETLSKRYKEDLLKPSFEGKHLTEEMKEKISNSMIIAHKEGRAWNIGMSRWNNEPSYPEKFFMQVIENEFEDKNYQREYPVSRYSIDFTWLEKRLAIEIDGAQHKKPDYKERDKRKDDYLKKNGWKVLRIKWEDMFHEPQKYI